MELPTFTPGGGILQYTAPVDSNVSGNRHSEVKSLPGCKLDVKDERHQYHVAGAQVQLTVDPDDPNHLVGEKETVVPHSRSLITWNLIRGA
jgi:hypothetical protein